MAYKKVYVGSGTSILSIVGLFVILASMGLTIRSDGDKYCAGSFEDPCVSYINVTNPTATSIYIYNREGLKLDFSPRIKDYELYVKFRGKWVNYNFTTKFPGVPKDSVYIFAFAARSTKELKLVGYKEKPNDVIKWGIGLVGDYLDPIWLPPVGNGELKLGCLDLIIEFYNYQNGTIIVQENYTYWDANISQNVTFYYNMTYPTYALGNNTYCKNESLIIVTDKGPLDLNGSEYTIALLPNNTAVLKDLSRGGTWKDTKIDECWNPGVPCVIIDDKGKVLFKYEDYDKKWKPIKLKE